MNSMGNRLSFLAATAACFFLAAMISTLIAAPPAGTVWEPIPELSDEFNTIHPNPSGDGIDSTKWWDFHPTWSGRLPSQFNANNT